MKAIEILVKEIVNNELHYYCATGSYVYIAEYEDGQMELVHNGLSAKAARPDVDFVMVASARWENNMTGPCWMIYDADNEAVATVSTDLDGIVTDPDDDVFYY